MGFITSVTVMAEIGDFNNFKKPKELVAFLGLDPSVFESGKFKNTKNKISKRGSTFARRALYTVALASVRISTNGNPVNPVLLNNYKSKLSNKKKMVAIVAIMHKLTNYIFSVLRNQQEYELRLPTAHQQYFLANKAAA